MLLAAGTTPFLGSRAASIAPATGQEAEHALMISRAPPVKVYTPNMTRRTLLTALGALPLAAATVPRPAGEFAVTLPDRRVVKLSDRRGKVLAFAGVLTT